MTRLLAADEHHGYLGQFLEECGLVHQMALGFLIGLAVEDEVGIAVAFVHNVIALLAAIQTLVDAGYPEEAVMVELILSGEFAYSLEKIVELAREIRSEGSEFECLAPEPFVKKSRKWQA
jgi:hypothetical protein